MVLYKKVLIVDDDPATRLIVAQVLKKLDFVTFLEASSGEEAIAIAYEKRPDLILMDICMPGMDGYEACRQIKSDPLLKSTIIIFMTAVCMDEINDKIIQVGGDDLLRKPLDASELYFRVKNYLTLMVSNKDESQRPENEYKSNEVFHLCDEESTVSLGQGFFYQYNLKALCKENSFIPLMRQEILLLETLLQHKNRMVSYELLLNAISQEHESSIANVRTLVKLLRRKTYSGLIKNLNSYGYQLVME
jgi:DNA-binding response OmpR family regulator